MEATWKLVGGLVLYPLCWLLEGLVAWSVGGPWLLAGFLAWLVPGGIWLLAWHGRWARLVYRARETTWALAPCSSVPRAARRAPRDRGRYARSHGRGRAGRAGLGRRGPGGIRARRRGGIGGGIPETVMILVARPAQQRPDMETRNPRSLTVGPRSSRGSSTTSPTPPCRRCHGHRLLRVLRARGVVGNDRGEGDLWWGRVVSLSMAIVAVMSPFLGAVADRSGVRRPLFIALHASRRRRHRAHGHGRARDDRLGASSSASSAMSASRAPSSTTTPGSRAGPTRPSWAPVRLGLRRGLCRLHRRSAHRPAILAGQGVRRRFPRRRRALRRLRAAGLRPASDGTVGRGTPPRRPPHGCRRGRAGIRTIWAHRELRRFFAAYFVYEDGVNTVVAFSAIFAAQTLGFPMDRLIVLYIVVQLSALLGALAWGAPPTASGPAAW